MLEGTFRGHLVQPPAVSRDIFNQTRLLRAPSNLTWNVSRDAASTTSLGNLCQGSATLIIKNFFLLSSLTLSSFWFKTITVDGKRARRHELVEVAAEGIVVLEDEASQWCVFC